MGDAAASRAARIAALRAKHQKADASHEVASEAAPSPVEARPAKRARDETAEMEDAEMQGEVILDENGDIIEEVIEPMTVDEQSAQIAESLLQKAKASQKSDLDLSALAARKPNADLKRDLASKLEDLERLTKIKIAEHIRDRLVQEGASNDLAQQVNMSVAANAMDDMM